MRIVLGIAIALGMAANVAVAGGPSLKRTPLLEETFNSSVAVEGVKAAKVEFLPGQASGYHRHPIPVVGVVADGSFVFQPHGQPERVLHAGDAFYEPANVPIDHFDNASSTDPATIEAFYLVNGSNQPTIEMLARP